MCARNEVKIDNFLYSLIIFYFPPTRASCDLFYFYLFLLENIQITLKNMKKITNYIVNCKTKKKSENEKYRKRIFYCYKKKTLKVIFMDFLLHFICHVNIINVV